MSATLNLSRLAMIAWVLLCASMLLLMGVATDWGHRVRLALPEPGTKKTERGDAALQPLFSLPPIADFAAISARPLFVSGRQPPPVPAPPKPAMQKGQFVLMGALMTGGKNIALLREVSSGKSKRVEQGGSINGITLATVAPDKVTLTQYDDSEELALKVQSSPKSAPPPAPPAGAPAATPAPAVPGVGAAPAPEGSSPQSLINRRRALRGLPPI